MTSDGSKVVFTSNAQLTPSDTDTSADMYMWSESTGAITVLSQGNGQGDTDDCNAVWTPQCGVQPVSTQRPELDNRIASSSGAVYFYSSESLDPNAFGVAQQRNLYVYRAGHAQFITSFDPGTQVDRMPISPDGSHAAFLTTSKLTGYDNAGHEEMYAYDAVSGNLKCVSCNPSGAPPTTNVAASDGGPFMSNDGRTFFSTGDALVPADTDGLFDVYEYVDGRPQLISAGTGSQDLFTGAFAELLLSLAPDRIGGCKRERRRRLLLDLRHTGSAGPERRLRQVL